MSKTDRNPWRDARRREKVMRLTNVLDRIAVERGIDPIERAGELAMLFAGKPESWWQKVAVEANVIVPSDETVKLVVAGYLDRERLGKERVS